LPTYIIVGTQPHCWWSTWGFYNSYHGCYSTTIRVLTGFLQRIMGQLLSWLLLNTYISRRAWHKDQEGVNSYHSCHSSDLNKEQNACIIDVNSYHSCHSRDFLEFNSASPG